MLTYDAARIAADYLRARREVERAPLAGFVALLLVGAVVYAWPHTTNLRWVGGLCAALILLPWFLRRILPAGNLMVYRMALAAYLVNGLLLGFVVFMELWRADPFPVKDFPALGMILPWVGLLVPGTYLVLQFPHWVRRIALYPEIARVLADPVPTAAVGEVAGLVAQAQSYEPSMEAAWAEFRSVPATPGRWRMYLQLDTEVHGVWRIGFGPEYAVVVFHDGSRMEAVPKGGLKLVTDDPKPGSKTVLCLIRWNSHLFEGRITQDNFLKVKAWNQVRPANAEA